MSGIKRIELSGIVVRVPSTPVQGKTETGSVEICDQYGRSYLPMNETIQLNADDNIELSENQIAFEPGSPGHKTFGFKCTAMKPGKISAKLVSKNITATSNPMEPVKAGNQRLFWGDIHVHSVFSDGLGTPEENYAFAQDVARLDFCAIADHDVFPHDFTEAEWYRTQRAARDFNEPGRFVTFLGYEWDASRYGYGHMNVYYLRDGQPVFTTEDSRSNTPEKLFDCLRDKDATVIVHHPAATKDGWFTTDWDHFDGGLEKLVEIHSIWGSSECSERDGNTHPIGRLGGLAGHGAGCFVRDALDRGYKLGLIGGGDCHDGRAGCSALHKLDPVENPNAYTFQHTPYYPSGIQGVWADGLTREAIWKAMLDRRTYATTSARMIVRFSLGDSPMGSVVTLSGGHAHDVYLDVMGTADIDRVELLRNGRRFVSRQGDGNTVDTLFPIQPEKETDYFYARVIQKDGHTAWTSPIWVNWR